ncbi:Ammonium transporter [Hondaea fermentalgiana]|uniref:Ammonium transporter n=1 Tax=Hondaea fermentalgiana TaxID=2315210 RepID=A0A2R5GTU5_9STRA|nr:Ammonium transporter [Hondaea fermentalgiana]|eukprot:GBG34297.1 Ammonium transporter [Hondaea fermentalgiana]
MSVTYATTEELAAMQEQLTSNLSVVWILLNSINIMLMQTGFAMLEAGAVHRKHIKSILSKNLMDCAIGTLAWWGFGYSIFTMSNEFATNKTESFAGFFLMFAFAVTCGTIASGAVVGRLRFPTYMILAFFIIGCLYPLIAGWVWSEKGFLYGRYTDVAGGVVVHGVGGVCAFVAAALIGPRNDRFDGLGTGDVVVVPSPGNSPPLQVLGALLLFCAWFSFNGVSAGLGDAEGLNAASRAMVTTLLASSAAACVGLILVRSITGYYDLGVTFNCLLAGLVSVTGNCSLIDTWAAVLIGAISAPVFIWSDRFILYKLHVDDPISASALHGVVGIYGGLCTGVFHRTEGVIHGHGDLLLVQLWGTLLIVVVSGVSVFVVLQVLRLFSPKRKLTVSAEAQLLGMDFYYHDRDIIENLTAARIREFNVRKQAMARALALSEKTSSSHSDGTASQAASSLSADVVVGDMDFEAKKPVFSLLHKKSGV